jgi:hypothetical protein
MRVGLTVAVLAALALPSCSSSGDSIFQPAVILRLELPAGMPPALAECLDVVLSSPTGEPPPTSVGFGGNPLFLRVQTIDLNGDGRPETRIRFVQGSTPFISARSDILLTPGPASGSDPRAIFTVAATVRRADGTIAPEDRCLGGTALAEGNAQLDAQNQPIRFPQGGDTLVNVSLVCVAAGGCGVDGGVADGGAPVDGGVVADGGAPDGGVAQDGGVAADGGTGADGGIADGGTETDGGVSDGGATDGG